MSINDWLRRGRAALARDWAAAAEPLRALLRSAGMRDALRLCLPALAVGLALRAYLCAVAPYGYFLSDTRNFIDAAKDFLQSPLSVFGVATRTFLASMLYAIPVAFDAPLLRVVPWIQHAIGLAMIVFSGLLCAAWFRGWRIWIVPVTLVVAVHPTLLWYEHMVLPESMFVALTVAVAVALALFLRIPAPQTFFLLLATIFLTAGARQEGFLYTLAALAACVLVFRHNRVQMACYLAGTGAFVLLVTSASRTTQGGQMLLTSMIHLAPDRLWSAPDFSARAVALREHFRPMWPIYPDRHNESRKILLPEVTDFLMKDRGLSEAQERASNNKFCKRVGMEIAARNAWVLPGMAYYKWLATHVEEPSPLFEAVWPSEYAFKKAFGKDDAKERRYLRRLFGVRYDSGEEFQRDLKEKYYREEGLGPLRAWQEAFIGFELWPQDPTQVPMAGPPGAEQPVPRMPWLYPVGFAGLLAAACANPRRRMEILSWVAMLCFTGFVVSIVGSLRSRYRLSFEPYWWIGLAGLLESVRVLALAGWAWWRARRSGRPGRDPE